MSVNFNKINGVNSIYKSQKPQAAKGVQGTAQVKTGRDQLEISKEAADFQAVMKSVKEMKNLPDVREEKLAPLKEKIEKDTYNVDGKNIAEKWLGNIFNKKM